MTPDLRGDLHVEKRVTVLRSSPEKKRSLIIPLRKKERAILHQIHPDCSYENSFLKLRQKQRKEPWSLGNSLSNHREVNVNMSKVSNTYTWKELTACQAVLRPYMNHVT